MEKKFFRNLVIAGFFRSLTLSVTGLIDCAVVGRYLGTDGLSAMKLAMPIFSLFALFSVVFSTAVGSFRHVRDRRPVYGGRDLYSGGVLAAVCRPVA